MLTRKNYDIHGQTRANAVDLAEIAIYYEERKEKYKTRSLASLLRAATEDLAQMIRNKNKDTRKLHPDDAIEALEDLGILPRSREFLLHKFKEIKKRDTSRLNEIELEKEYQQNLQASIQDNLEDLNLDNTTDLKTNEQQFNSVHSTVLKSLQQKGKPEIVLPRSDAILLREESEKLLPKSRTIQEQIDTDPMSATWKRLPPDSDGGKYYIENWKTIVEKTELANKKAIIKRSMQRANG